MSEEQRFGDGQDNYLQGMQQAAEAARQFGSAAGSAGASGAAAGEAAANAAAATVKAGVETGKAVQMMRPVLRQAPMGSRSVRRMVAPAHPV